MPSIKKVAKEAPTEYLSANGLMYHDHEALNLCQRQCMTRTSQTIQLEQEAYLSQHPEIFAMLELFISEQSRVMKRQGNIIHETGLFFLQPFEQLDDAIRKRLGVGPNDPYLKSNRGTFKIDDDLKLDNDLRDIIKMHYPTRTWSVGSSSQEIFNTESSSFLSAITSDTTLPTPEPEGPPELTLPELMMTIVSDTVDKAIYTRFDDQAVLYDSAYVAVAKAVEEAMEIPVIEIREDIAELIYNAFKMFEIIMDEKQRKIDEIKWEKRMRKKMKRTLRRQENFKGYETPPSTSSISSHESYRRAPPRPCACHPQWLYNRYPKDRFGIYLPSEEQYPAENATVTPEISLQEIPIVEQEDEEDEHDAPSVSKKSTKSSKTAVVKFQ